jgi:hypothetical protein
MNKDRIQINGKWYVAEQPEEDVEFDSGDLTFFRGCVYETDSSCFEFSNLTNEEGEPYGSDLSFSVEYTDKRFKDRKDWKIDYWDNVNWFMGLIQGNPDSLHELESIVDKEDAKLLIAALRHLKTLEWF